MHSPDSKKTKNPLSEIAAYRQQAIYSTLCTNDDRAFCWYLAAEEATSFYNQTTFFKLPKTFSVHDVASLARTQQVIEILSSSKRKQNTQSSLHWMFSNNERIGEPLDHYRYWIARSLENTSPHLVEEKKTVIKAFDNLPEGKIFLHEVLSYFEAVQQLEKKNENKNLLEEVILLHRAKAVAFTAFYLVILKSQRAKAQKENQNKSLPLLNKMVHCLEKELALRQRILEATQQGKEREVRYLILLVTSWSNIKNCYQQAAEELLQNSKNSSSWHQTASYGAQAAATSQGLVEIILATSNKKAASFLEHVLFLLKNAFDYRMQMMGVTPILNDKFAGLLKKTSLITKLSSFLWTRAAYAAIAFPSWPTLTRFWKATALYFEYQARNKVQQIVIWNKTQQAEDTLKDSIEEKKQERKKNRSIFLEKISFCLPPEAFPDAATQEAWNQGKIVPELEYSVPHAWIYQTWKLLQNAGMNYPLSTQPLEPGIVIGWGFYVTNSLRAEQPLPADSFFVDIIGDQIPNPHAHLYLTQNRTYAKYVPHSVFIPHWPQRNLMPRNPDRGNSFENVAFLGHLSNCTEELQSEAWKQRLSHELGLTFCLQDHTGWHDYSAVDAVVAIRSFSKRRYFYKPATKLYNAWLAGVPFIAGPESAYAEAGTPGEDYLVATSIEELLGHLKRLKEDLPFRRQLVERGRSQARAFTQEATLERWKELLQTTIPAYAAKWQKKSPLQRRWFFFVNRLIYFLNFYLQA
ncbi:MAG: glycosyltransferase [Chthoniobacterales bacterium]|nr:glycosyltransferase [Chthoniobacterales bacterium]